MINDSTWEEMSPIHGEDPDESSPPSQSIDEEPTDYVKEEIKRLFGIEEEILQAVRDYPDYPTRTVKTPTGAIFTNTPDYREVMHITVPQITGIKGYNPFNTKDGVVVEVENLIDTRNNNFDPEKYGVHSRTNLVLGAYGDSATQEDMERYLAHDPTKAYRYWTSFVTDGEGNGYVTYKMPDFFPRPTDGVKEITHDDIDEEFTVVKDITPRELEIMAFALNELKKKLPDQTDK